MSYVVDERQEQDEQLVRFDMRRRVRDGMAALDERCPGWENHIDIPSLDLGCALLCIAGQTERWKGQIIFQYDTSRQHFPPELGMDLMVTDHASPFSADQLYSMLTEEWVAAIMLRRGEQAR